MADPEETGAIRVNNTIRKLAEQYAASLTRSSNENEERANIRENAEKLGIPSKSFQAAVSMVKIMSPGERADYQNGVNRMLEAIGDDETVRELFPEDAARIERRMEKQRKEREAEKRDRAEAGEGDETTEGQTEGAEIETGEGGDKPTPPKGSKGRQRAPGKAKGDSGGGKGAAKAKGAGRAAKPAKKAAKKSAPKPAKKAKATKAAPAPAAKTLRDANKAGDQQISDVADLAEERARRTRIVGEQRHHGDGSEADLIPPKSEAN